MGNFETKEYRNLFSEVGISQSEIDKRLEEIWQEFFYSADCVYHEAGSDMGYIEDTGNNDARTEGMSYGMMICVQMNKKQEFDRIWKWAKTYMYMKKGINEGYFAWSCKTNGRKNSTGPAPDGEEYFAMALFFASHRWGDGEGIYNYSHEAIEILLACLHKGENGIKGAPMWNHENKQILFVPGIDFTDPSYHLPHFYDLFALWAYEEDRDFWKQAANASREFLVKACHKETGLNPEYAEFDASPFTRKLPWSKDRRDRFYSDAYRTVANIALDYEWNKIDIGQTKAAANIQKFFGQTRHDDPYLVYEIDGTPISEEAMHPVAITVTVAQGSLAVLGRGDSDKDDLAKYWIKRFWNLPLRKGVRRYYDNCLYFFAFLALSGNYRIY